MGMVDGDEGSVCKVKTQEAENFDEAGLGTSIIQRNSQATARYLFHPLGPKDSPRLWTICLIIKVKTLAPASRPASKE